MLHLVFQYNLTEIFLINSGIIVVAILIDFIFGDPPVKIHPVVWMGKIISFLEKRLRSQNPSIEKLKGFVLVFLTITIFSFPIFMIFNLYFLLFYPFDILELIIFVIISGSILKISFAIKSLRNYTLPIAVALKKGDINKAREYIPFIARRDPLNLDEEGLISTATESIAESTADGVTSPLFYFAFFGVIGAIIFRVVNTLDSMVGYKDSDKINIGMASARLDDILNFIPVRITFVFMILSSCFIRESPRNGLKIVMRDHSKVESPNAGWTMASMAGILSIQLKKDNYYKLGDPIHSLNPSHIEKALKIFYLTVFFFILSMLAFSTFIFLIARLMSIWYFSLYI
ncbi:MAG: cobalamin biosynthesis protein [Candidatus Lokiarchaeota archaeon]|nr:cobalamin biosynthesis protein [Candidatus Lokiarchaeota archaeon]